MSLVNILNVTVLDNPTSFLNPFQFEVQFECLQSLEDDIEWKLIYVGNAEDSSGDQVLEEVMVGPIIPGVHRFVLQAPAPNHQLIQNHDLIGVTVILLTCSYNDQEFVRIGYYVNNEYSLPYDPESPPNPVDVNFLFRSILADQPRVTRFAIHWTAADAAVAATALAMATAVGSSGVGGDGNGAISGDGAIEDDDLVEMDDEEDEDEEEDEEDDDLDAEIDIEAEEEMSNDEDEEEGDEEEEEEAGDEGAAAAVDPSNIILCEDSMDVYHMQQIAIEGSNLTAHSF